LRRQRGQRGPAVGALIAFFLLDPVCRSIIRLRVQDGFEEVA
jgi:hypothetical protein